MTAAPCTCIARINAAFKARNTELDLALFMSGRPASMQIKTVLLEKRRGQRPMALLPTYCPFCGVKIEAPE